MAGSSESKLGTMPVGRLLTVMSVPMMISMFIQALYNVVDSMFVAQISENALTAVSLAFPVQNIMNAIGVGTGVGVNALVSRSLGRGDSATAEKAANVQLTLAVIWWLIAAALGIPLARLFFATQTDIAEIVDYGTVYMSICCGASLGLFASQHMEKLLVSTGNSRVSMIAQGSGAVVNIAFDPLLIFGLGPFPALGVPGAAVATVLGQFTAAGLAFFFNVRCNTATHFRVRKMGLNLRIIRDIYTVGLPSALTVGLNSVMSYCMNAILLGVSTTATAVFGIWIKAQSFGYMPVFGMNNGTIAIYSYNYGAKLYDRVRATLRLAAITGVLITAAVALLYELIPEPIMHLFNASDNMMDIGVTAMRTMALSLPMGGLCVICSSSLQSLGKPGQAFFAQTCRQLIFQVPAAYILCTLGGLRAFWFAPLIAETLAMIMALVLAVRRVRSL